MSRENWSCCDKNDLRMHWGEQRAFGRAIREKEMKKGSRGKKMRIEQGRDQEDER
jgi:hypothetical protein